MRILLAYLLATGVVMLFEYMGRTFIHRAMQEARQAPVPIDVSRRIRKALLTSGLASGLLCGPIFVLIGRSTPLLHCSVVALYCVLGLVAVWWFKRHEPVLENAPSGVNVTLTFWELAQTAWPFPVALFVSALVALYVAA